MRLNMAKIAAHMQHVAFVEEVAGLGTKYRAVAIIENISEKYFVVLAPLQNNGVFYLHNASVSGRSDVTVGDRICELPKDEFGKYKYDQYFEHSNIEFIQELLVCTDKTFTDTVDRIYGVYSCMLDLISMHGKMPLLSIFRSPFHR